MFPSRKRDRNNKDTSINESDYKFKQDNKGRRNKKRQILTEIESLNLDIPQNIIKFRDFFMEQL